MAPAFHVLSADDPLHDQALDQTFAQWNDQLTREGYAQYNRAQLRTAWGARHLERVGLVSDGLLLASAKRYQVSVRLGGRTVPTIGIGAVFTPPEHRRHGHAAALIEHIKSLSPPATSPAPPLVPSAAPTTPAPAPGPGARK